MDREKSAVLFASAACIGDAPGADFALKADGNDSGVFNNLPGLKSGLPASRDSGTGADAGFFLAGDLRSLPFWTQFQGSAFRLHEMTAKRVKLEA